jgi:hypothetical protein
VGLAHDEGIDSLLCDWPDTYTGCFAWLNPPYADIAPWVQKCDRTRGMRIAALLPASIGSNWFADHVWGRAYVVALQGRVTFVGHRAPYPKDLILALYGFNMVGFSVWKWN